MLVPILGSLFALIGGWMSALALHHWKRRRVFQRLSTRAEGTIVGLIEIREHAEPSSFPRIRFHTPGGREITFDSGMGSSNSPWSVGDTVQVRYRPDQPHAAEIDSFLALWGVPSIFGVLGGVFLFLGLGLLLGLVPV